MADVKVPPEGKKAATIGPWLGSMAQDLPCPGSQRDPRDAIHAPHLRQSRACWPPADVVTIKAPLMARADAITLPTSGERNC